MPYPAACAINTSERCRHARERMTSEEPQTQNGSLKRRCRARLSTHVDRTNVKGLRRTRLGRGPCTLTITPSPPPRACLRSTPAPVSTPKRPSMSAPPLTVDALQLDAAVSCACARALYPATSAPACRHQSTYHRRIADEMRRLERGRRRTPGATSQCMPTPTSMRQTAGGFTCPWLPWRPADTRHPRSCVHPSISTPAPVLTDCAPCADWVSECPMRASV